MKLYYSPGACSLSVHIALREAERAFELERVDLRSKRTASGGDYRIINAKGYVPALQLDGPGSEILTEAPAVLLYVADLVPEQGLAPPAGTFARYRVIEWLSFLSSELHKQFSPLFVPDTPALTQERLRSKIHDRLSYVSHAMFDTAYVMGERFTVADCYLFVMLRWLERFGMDIHTWPNLEDYFHRVMERPSVHAAVIAEGLVETRRHRKSA